METWTKVAIGIGAALAAGGVGIFSWRKLKKKEDIQPEPEKRDDKNLKTSVNIEKPDLDEFLNERIISWENYNTAKNEEKEEPKKPKEGDPHICSERDYVETYIDYYHHTCTWYPSEKRLVDLDLNFEILVPPEHYIGKMAAEALVAGTEGGSAMYAVNHELETTYEIIVADENQVYSEDLAQYSVETSLSTGR